MRRALLLASIASLWLVGSPVFGQTGGVRVRVVDVGSSAPLPGVTVSLSNVHGLVKTSTVLTDAEVVFTGTVYMQFRRHTGAVQGQIGDDAVGDVHLAVVAGMGEKDRWRICGYLIPTIYASWVILKMVMIHFSHRMVSGLLSLRAVS